MVFVVYIQQQNATVSLAEAVWPPRAAFSLSYLCNLLFSPKQQNQFQERRGPCGSHSRVQSRVAEEPWWQNSETVGHFAPPVRMQREKRLVFLSSLFYLVSDPSLLDSGAHIYGSLPIPVNPSPLPMPSYSRSSQMGD